MSENEKCSHVDTGDELEELAQVFDNRTERLITERKHMEEYTDEPRDTNEQLQQEVSERKRVAEALRKSEELYKSLVENIDLGVTLVDSEHNILMANAMRGRLFKKSSRNIVGKKCFRELEKRDSVCPHCPGIRAMSTGEAEEIETEGVLDDGSRFRAKIQAFPTFGNDDEVSGFIEVLEDITEKKRLEARIQQTQRIEAIGTLAGGIAHDLNNVLYPIVGYAELTINDVPGGSAAQSNLHEIIQAANRAKDLVQQILAFSRQTENERKPLRIQSIVKEAIKLIRSSIPTSIGIRRNIDDDCGPVMADPTQVHQVVMNLCINASHAMGENGGVLEVTLMEEQVGSNESESNPNILPGTYLKLTVRDTGHGIDNGMIERIFDPYFTTKAPGEGSGMGLAAVHGIVKSHEGEIRVYSEPGEGAMFHVYLPRIDAGPTKPGTTSTGPVQKGHERILFVDDEAQIVRAVQKMLERYGYHVTPRTSSVEALEAFRAQPDRFDLIITDVTMPNMTGSELARKLLEIRPDIPIIICTGFSETMDEEKARAMGIREYVIKPISVGEMTGTIRKVMDREMEDRRLNLEW